MWNLGCYGRSVEVSEAGGVYPIKTPERSMDRTCSFLTRPSRTHYLNDCSHDLFVNRGL